MLAPLEKATILISDFTARLNSSLYIENEDEFRYRLELKDISKDSPNGYFVWGLYYACRQQRDRAVSQLKKSLAFGDPHEISSYFIYLKRVGLVDDFIEQVTTLKSAGKYLDNPDMIKEYILCSFMEGDIALSIYYAERLAKLNYDWVDDFKNNINGFIATSKLSEDDLVKLILRVKSMISHKEIPFTGMWLNFIPEETALFFIGVINFNPVDILKLQVEISTLLIKEGLLFDQETSIILREIASKMDMLPIEVSFSEGFYTAVCDALHLVTEASSLSELQSQIWDLVPDLIELNDAPLDVNNVSFDFHFDQSAKNYIRGL